jgi:Ca2+-dependent lipid-binding protein
MISLILGKIKTQMIEPQGVLTITIERANNLIIGDYNSSDPYVVMTLNNHEQRTETKDKTLNPIWNDATFNFLVYDKENETLLFEVWDEDSFKRGMCI